MALYWVTRAPFSTVIMTNEVETSEKLIPVNQIRIAAVYTHA